MMEHIEGLSIDLNLETAGLDTGLKGLKGQMKTLSSELKANMSVFDRADRSIEKYETQVKGLNRRLELQTQITAKSREEYEKMVREHGEGSKQAEKAARAYNNEIAALNNLRRYVVNVRQELADLREEQRISESTWGRMGRLFDETGESLTNLGGKMKDVGTSLSTNLTLPIVAAGAGITGIASQFENSSVKIQNSLGLTAEEAKNLTNISRNLYKDGFGESVEDIDSALLQTKQNMKDINEEDLDKVTKKALLLAETFDGEVNEVTRAGNNVMKAFGVSSDKAFDIMAHGAQNGLNFSNEMFDNLSEYAPLFGKMGFSAEEYFQLLEKGSKAGVYNLDYINDVMKEFQIKLKDGSTSTKDAMAQLSGGANKVWKSYLDGKSTVKDVHNAIIKELKNMDNQTKANNIGVGLYGTKWEDLEADAMYALGGINGKLKDVDGRVDKMSKNMEQSFGTRVKSIWRETTDAFRPFGEVLLDVAEDILPKIADTVEDVTTAFTNLSPEAKKTILAVAGVGAAAGPVLMVMGSLTTGVGALFKAVGPLIGALGTEAGMAGALAALTNPIGLTVLAVAGLGAGFYALDKEMDKPIIKSDIFKGKISEATQEAVGSYMALDEQATAELNSLAWSNQTITDEMAKNMVAKYQEMGDQVLQAMKENHDEQLAEQQRLFDESSILTEEEEAKRIAKLKADQLKEEEAHTEQQARMKEIWTAAAEEKRGLTDAEAQEIAALQAQMRTKAVEELSASQEEQLTILNNIKEQKGLLETESAADTVKKSAETRDKVIADTNKEYEQRIATIEEGRDVLGTIKSKEADKMIEEAERSKNETIAKAQDTHTEVVNTAKKQAGDHADQVNWETGEVLSGWDSMYNGVISAVNWIRGLFDKEPLTKKGTVKENGRQKLKRQNAKLEAYANGTPSSGHPGGPAIVGEEGRELAFIPGKGVTLLGAKGPEFHSNLPYGTSVLPNKQTEKMLKSYGFPGYADGIGDYFDMFLKGAGSVWDFTKDKFDLKDISSILDSHTGSPLKYIGDMATDWIKGVWDNWFDIGDVFGAPSGKSVSRWKSVILKAAATMNESITGAELNGILAQIQRESGGNEKIVQSSAVWDVNTAAGNPARGLLQYIPQTFSAYAVKGHSNIFSGYDQLLAFFNNKTWRSDLPYGKSGWGPKGGRKFESGGLINTAGLYELAEGGWPEFVIPTDPSRRTDAMKLLALAGKQIQGNKRPNQLSNVGNSNGSTDNNSLLQAVLEQNRILMALLQSSQNIEKKPILSEGDIGRAAERYDAKQSSKHSIFKGRVAPI